MPLRLTTPACGLAALAAIFLAAPTPARAQSIPAQSYYDSFGLYYEGRYGEALKEFQAELRGGIKGTNGRWIDSICYYTMVGECQYQMGQHAQALENYTAALQLYLKFSEWLIQIRTPPALRTTPIGQLTICPWGNSTRTAKIADAPGNMLMSAGGITGLPGGAVINNSRQFSLQATELVRCTCQAMRRRRELLGPVAPHDVLSGALVKALFTRPVAPNSWLEAWIDIQLGLAYAGVGDDGQAKALLTRGMIAAGEFDHPLTAICLIELGRIALSSNDGAAAARLFEEASYSAYQFGEVGLIEESLRYGHLTHLMTSPRQPYPPLPLAANWARVKSYNQVQASMLLMEAEDLCILNRPADAGNALATVRTVIGNRDMARSKIGAKFNWLSAQHAYQQGKVQPGDASIQQALAFQKGGGSLWLHHVALVDSLFVQNKISDREALALFRQVLRDPQPADWTTDPLESLSVLAVPHGEAFEHWFQAALDKKDHESALEISDYARRHRFLATLPLGGRLLNLRWLMEGPLDAADPQLALQRQDVLARHPAYGELSREALRLRNELARLPLVSTDPAQQKLQAEKFARLAEVSGLQEAILREVAVRREATNLVFPPVRKIKEIRESLAEGQGLLAFFATSQRMYAATVGRDIDKYEIRDLGASVALSRPIATLLRDCGNFDQNREVPLAELGQVTWRKPAKQVHDLLIKGLKTELYGKYNELVIVPDQVLWYLPFEALPVGDDKNPQLLIQRCRVRYAPTLSLATAPGQTRKRAANMGVVVGKVYPNADAAVAQSAWGQINDGVKGAFALKAPLPATSGVLASAIDRLLVLDEIPLIDSAAAAYDWSPIPLDRGTLGSSIDAWMQLPWGAPDQVFLPAYHTLAESALKRTGKSSTAETPGAEVFLSVCGLMASGSRTILISRWRTGGQTSFDLVREFVQELPHATAAEAWQRSVFLTMDTTLSFEAEPRIKANVNDNPPHATHPFLWSGYLLIDPGVMPQKEDEAAPAVIQLEKK